MTSADSRGARVFLASFLVLFLEVALIRWMPAYIRLLAYFSNFILLASFLGIGVGCLMAPSRRRLFTWFPLLQAVVIGAAYFFRLEVAVQPTGSIYFTSGTAEQVVVVESTMLLPLIFVIVAALFATLAQRMGREMAALPPLRGYTINLLGSLAGVGLFAVISWLQLSPTWWFGIGFAAAVPLLLSGESDGGGFARAGSVAVGVNIALLVLTLGLVHVMARGVAVVSVLQDHRRPGRPRHGRRGQQHLSPVDGAGRTEGVFLPVAVHGVRRHVRERARPRRRFGHGRRCGAEARREACRRRRNRSRSSSVSAGSITRITRTPIRASPSSPTTRGIFCGRRRRNTTSWSSR